MNEKWYRKDPPVVNAKLAKAIIDALPFDIDYKLAKVILRTIFDTVVKGVKRDGFVTIAGLGRFYAHKRPASRRGYILWLDHKKWVYAGVRRYPAQVEVKFLPCHRLRRSLDDEAKDNAQS